MERVSSTMHRRRSLASRPGTRRVMALLSVAVLALVVAASASADALDRARLPKVFLDTSYVPPSGDVIRVHAGDDLQAALDRAVSGDQVVLDAGATFTGNFVLPKKAAGSEPIVVRTSDLQALAEGVRAGPADAAHLARIVTPSFDGAVDTAPGSHDWRFVGIEFTVAPDVAENTGVLRLGTGSESTRSQLPRNIVVDRCWIHGDAAQNDRRGVALNGIVEAVVDSTVSDIHEKGIDAQAIAGWNGAGPFKIVNDELDASGENVMFGGADPAIAKLIPSDIEIRHNHFFKPLSWRVGDPSYAGVHWTVKNLFELKNARRVLVAGNVFENSWGDAQTGFAVLLKSANQEGAAPWSVTQDVTFTDNLVLHAASAMAIEGRDPGGAVSYTRRVTVAENLFDDIDGKTWKGSGDFLQITDGSSAPDGSKNGPGSLTVDHNTVFQTRNVISAEGVSKGFVYTNNITPHNRYGVHGSGLGTGLNTLNVDFPGAVFQRNVLIHAKCSDYPALNYCPATIGDVGFVDYPGGDYRLAAGSPYRGAGTLGSDVGADIDAIEAAVG
jgi:hypothetical protein